MCGCASSITSSGVRRSTITVNNPPLEPICDEMYQELAELDLIVTSILRIESDANLVQFNRTLREWIRNLDNECPDELELEVIKQYLQNEYPEYL